MNNPKILWLASAAPKTAEYNFFCNADFQLSHYKDLSLLPQWHEPAMVFLDLTSTQVNVPDWMRQLRARFPTTPIIVLVESGQSHLASEALSCGAVDYLLRPFTLSQLQTSVRNAQFMRQNISNIVAVSPVSQQVLRLANRAAQTHNATVLIQGESGCGKEKLAQFIHEMSDRKDKPFVAINCAAIPENMLEAMLFGHTKGAFTGAVSNVEGKFELANGGSLMLDEISELPMELQSKLLRVLQEREVERLGSHKKVQLDLRIIASSNKDLREQVRQGLFREDLYYRLEVLPLHWPGLRDRMEDVLPLAEHFIQKHGQDNFYFSQAAQHTLMSYSWPGNVRELENVVQRALVMARGMEIQAEDLGLPLIVTPTENCGQQLQQTKQQAEFEYICDLLRRFNGHRSQTAEALGMTTRALRYKLTAMREAGINVNAFTS